MQVASQLGEDGYQDGRKRFNKFASWWEHTYFYIDGGGNLSEWSRVVPQVACAEWGNRGAWLEEEEEEEEEEMNHD